jgi:hypothetical protein
MGQEREAVFPYQERREKKEESRFGRRSFQKEGEKSLVELVDTEDRGARKVSIALHILALVGKLCMVWSGMGSHSRATHPWLLGREG